MRLKFKAQVPFPAALACVPGASYALHSQSGLGEDAIVDQIIQGVLNEVCEYFDDEDCPA